MQALFDGKVMKIFRSSFTTNRIIFQISKNYSLARFERNLCKIYIIVVLIPA